MILFTANSLNVQEGKNTRNLGSCDEKGQLPLFQKVFILQSCRQIKHDWDNYQCQEGGKSQSKYDGP